VAPELQSQRQALIATAAELRLREQRWKELPGDDRSVSFVIAELLDAQDRLMRDEQLFAEAETNYAISVLELKRAMGTLVIGDSLSR
jgi:outer membrane protein TolC